MVLKFKRTKNRHRFRRVFQDGYFFKDNEIEKYVGCELNYDDLEKMEGCQFVYGSPTQSRMWYKVCRVVKMSHDDTMYEGYHRRLVYNDRPRKKNYKGDLCSVNEYWMYNGTYRFKCYELRRW